MMCEYLKIMLSNRTQISSSGKTFMILNVHTYICEIAVFLFIIWLSITVYKRKEWKNEFFLYIKKVNLRSFIRERIYFCSIKIYKLVACISLSDLCKLIGGRNPVWGTRTWCLSVVLNVRQDDDSSSRDVACAIKLIECETVSWLR